MTLIVGNVVDVGLAGVDGTLRVWAWFRPEEVGLIAPYRREWEITGGEIEAGVDVIPGPAAVEIDCGPNAYTTVDVTVPDADVVTIQDLFEQVYSYTPRAVSDAYAERLRAEVAAAAAAGSAQAAEDAASSFGLTASASTLAPGSSATVDVTGDGPAYGLVFGVPTGEQGPQGSRGPAGSQEIGWTDDGMPYLLEPSDEPAIQSGEIVAAGRPDTSATMDFDTRAAVNAAPTGAMFRSTDGPQGAWAWRKNPNGQWSVVDGDTGWRNVISTLESNGATGVSGRLRLKRTAGLVWVSADDVQVASGTVILIPEASFQIDADNATYPGALYNLAGDRMQRLDTARLRFSVTGSGCRLRDLRSYPNTRPWPTTLPGTPA